MFFFDPLEQFDIINVFPIFLSYFPTNLNIILFFNLFLILFILNFSGFQQRFIFENKYSNNFNIYFWASSKIYDLIFDMIDENVVVKKKSFILLVFYLFIFLFICNLVGMIPFSYTITSSLILTFFLATSFFIGINLIGFYHNKSSIFKTFLPGGSPILIAPLLILIEAISYLSRIFSLSIRLFANMMSGHALLKILIGFSWTALIATQPIFINSLAILPWIVVSAVMLLELSIAALQAYVFTVLICIYINDAINPH